MSSTHAPGTLRLLQDFVNTLEPDVRDEIHDPDAATQWLRDAGLPGSVDGPLELRELVELRGALIDLLRANAGHSAVGWDRLQPFSAQTRLRIRSGPGLRLEPAATSTVEAALGALLAIVYDAVRDGAWSRLKICQADTCAWAFYDRSKNGSGAWCSMAVCGNRAKARRRRERDKRSRSAP